MSDKERQEDEIFALENICEPREFKCVKTKLIECSFSVTCDLASEKLLIKNDWYQKNIYIRYLPPIRYYVQLPHNYPSECAPKYNVAINWLPPWMVSFVCQKLDDLWQENENNEILFIWLEFFKIDLLSYLNLKDTLDVSYLFHLYKNPANQFLIDVLQLCDNRVIYGGLYLDPIEKLLEYDVLGESLEFENSIQECSICTLTYSGKLCVRINICKHIFCKDCVKQFLTVKINDRNVNDIKCPAVDCKISLKSKQIQEMCSADFFEKYEKCLWEIRQLSTRNLVYCPRRVCQTPVLVKAGENLASCTKCEYNFCAYCFKGYHGIMACDMDSEKKNKLIVEYENGNIATRKFLEKKYGKNQIRQLVESHLNKKYLEENTKQCPACGATTTKVSGCNVVNCIRCRTNFCWLCNVKITSNDIYEHFKSTSDGPCVGRLMEGVEDIDGIDDEIHDLELLRNYEFIFNNDFD